MERDPRRSPRHGGVIFEFEPLVATRLMEQARGLLAFGLAAAVVMMLVAGVSWGMSRRYERAKRHLEQERRLSLLGEMSAVLAHEIRNPLASLKGHAQLLAEHLPADSPDRRKADRVVMESSRLEALTSDLLDFVRVGPLERAPVDPVPILQASIEEAAGGGFDLRREQAPPSWPLDAARVRQVFINVLRNAHQASRPGDARPEVGLRVEGDLLVVTVRDHGEGLPKGQEERIFDPFFTTRTTGTGLGLAVARRIVELHGGTLTAANHPQGGAVFRIALPR
jgi:two-component system sensor histidine kinase HydH